MADWETYYKELVAGKRAGLANRLLLFVLVCCSYLYAAFMGLRAAAYAVKVLPVRRLERPVISVGNILAGGTGKTPTVAWLARYYMARGKRVAVLSRGYGGRLAGAVAVVSDGNTIQHSPEDAGDEPLLLARSIPGLIVVVGADRYKAGLLAQERFAPDLFILDDGFQHMRLHRDMNIVLLDCGNPFGNGRTFPAGLLREPKRAVGRADLVLLTRCNSDKKAAQNLPPELPVCSSSHVVSGYVPISGGPLAPFNDLAGRRGLAFAGIADPAAFFVSLERAGLRPVATLAFPDHTQYGEQEIAALRRLTVASRSSYLITTEKDAVKLTSHADALGTVLVAPLELQIYDVEVMEGLLEKLL